MASYPYIKDYQTALEFIAGGKSKTERTFLPGIKATTARIAPGTAAQGQTIIIKQHSTDILTYYQDGNIRLNSGGWRTVTAKDRMNHLTRARIHSSNGVWYIQTAEGWDKANQALFTDGMLIDAATGYPLLKDLDNSQTERLKAKLDKAITTYIKKYVEHCLETKTFPPPQAGDCLYCWMAANQTVGQAQTIQTGNGKLVNGKLVVEDTTNKPHLFPLDHLLSHIGLGEDPDELYVPLGSLAWLSFQGRHGDPAFVWQLQASDFAHGKQGPWHSTWLARNLRAYFKPKTQALLELMAEQEAWELEQQQSERGGEL